jgi:hypothetical protein
MDISRALDASLEQESSPDTSAPPIEYEEEEKEEKKEEKDGEWSKEDNNVNAPPFINPVGVHHIPHAVQSPLQYLQLFLPYQHMQLLTQYTKEYAQHKYGEMEWSTTPEELYAFIGAHIFIGICDLPAWHMYWSEEYQQPFIAQIFSRKRFAELLRYFQVVPYAPPAQPVDPLARVRSFSSYLNHLFPHYYSPSQHMSLDEAMVGFKGRSSIKQYIPSKPHKWGYKIYCLASDDYLLQFEIYEGKELHPSVPGPIHDTVLRLMLPYQHQQFIVFTDQWFTSTTLLSSLQQRGIRTCGAVNRKRRGLPDIEESSIKQLQRGDYMKRTKGDMSFIVWKEATPVRLLFNHISSDKVASLPRWNANHEQIQLPCPQAVRDYFYHARSVDVVGQLHYSYLIGRKSRKSWWRLVWWLIDMCIVNAFILYRMQHHGITQLAFRQQLMHELVYLFGANRNAIQVSRGANVSVALAKDHYPEHSGVQRDCKVCSKQPLHRKTSMIICHSCQVHLCIGECFALFHARV